MDLYLAAQDMIAHVIGCQVRSNETNLSNFSQETTKTLNTRWKSVSLNDSEIVIIKDNHAKDVIMAISWKFRDKIWGCSVDHREFGRGYKCISSDCVMGYCLSKKETVAQDLCCRPSVKDHIRGCSRSYCFPKGKVRLWSTTLSIACNNSGVVSHRA